MLPSPFVRFERKSETMGKLYYRTGKTIDTYSTGAVGMGPVRFVFFTDNKNGIQITDIGLHENSLIDQMNGSDEERYNFALASIRQFAETNMVDAGVYNTSLKIVKDVEEINKYIKNGQVRYLTNGDFAVA